MTEFKQNDVKQSLLHLTSAHTIFADLDGELHTPQTESELEIVSRLVSRLRIIEFVRTHENLRLRRVRAVSSDLSDLITRCNLDVEAGDVVAVAVVRRGFFRKRIHGYLCTDDALYSGYLEDGCLPFAGLTDVRLGPSGQGLRVSYSDGEDIVADFDEFNEEVLQLLSYIFDANKSAQGNC